MLIVLVSIIFDEYQLMPKISIHQTLRLPAFGLAVYVLSKYFTSLSVV